ncbi:unnamed protein product [Allacma fusca]|uniref:Uncharacterized protein n=1 Tax=Allacma fusca TaxID=39272 RepID=A0A8J2KJ89_9HEXA|nr:unnamed protein product [Allacma fusca]
MLSFCQTSSSRFEQSKRRNRVVPETSLAENVTYDMDPDVYLEVRRLLENDEDGLAVTDYRPVVKNSRDYKINGFTKQFQHQELLRHVKCSEKSCTATPSTDGYTFCNNFHLFCANCAENLLYCGYKSPTGDGRMCFQRFFRAKIPFYTSFLENECKFVCPNEKFGCSVVAQAGTLAKHFKECSSFPGSPFACKFTGCRSVPISFEDLVAHLKNYHQTIFVEQSVSAVSLKIPWIKRKSADVYTWIPAVFKTNNVYFLVAFRIQHGILYQWIYVEDKSSKYKDKGQIYILSGFETTEKGVTVLREHKGQTLATSAYKILDGDNCFAISFDNFFEEYMMLDALKQIWYFVLDLNIVFLP